MGGNTEKRIGFGEEPVQAANRLGTVFGEGRFSMGMRLLKTLLVMLAALVGGWLMWKALREPVQVGPGEGGHEPA